MKPAAGRVGVGTRFVYDGEVLEVVEMHPIAGTPEVLARDLRTDTVRRLALEEVRPSDRCHLLTDDLDVEISHCRSHPASVKWAAVSEQARQEARDRAAHVREVLSGYRSGSATTAMPHEPRSCYESAAPKMKRLAAKAKELGKARRTIERWVSAYEAEAKSDCCPRKRFNLRWAARSSRYLNRPHRTSCANTRTCRNQRWTSLSTTSKRD